MTKRPGQGGAISAVPVCGLSFTSPSVSLSVADPNRFPAGFKGTFASYLMPEHLLFSALRKSALPSGLAPVAKFKNISLAPAAGHHGLYSQKSIQGVFSYA